MRLHITMWKQKIPSHASIVHSWPTFDIYQREQELFDGTYKTFELARMQDAVKVILIDKEQHKILMVQDEQPWVTRITYAWGLVEAGEDLLQTAAREVQEETGYIYDTIQHIVSLPYTHRVSGSTYYYITSGLSQTSQTNPDRWSEKITVLEYTFDEFIDFICSPDNHSYFSYYLLTHYIVPHKKEELQKLLFG